MAQATNAVPNAEGLYECPEGCGKTFTRVQGLGRHLSETHGHPTTREAESKRRQRASGGDGTRGPAAYAVSGIISTPSSSLARETRDELAAIVGPLRERRRAIEARLSTLDREASELRAARRDVDSVLSKLDPSDAPKPKAPTANGNDEQKIAAVRRFVDEHADALAEGFTIEALLRQMNEAGVEPKMSSQKARVAVEALRDEGVVRADRVVKGGGMRFVLIGANGASA